MTEKRHPHERRRGGLSRLLALLLVSAVSFWLGRLSIKEEYERLHEQWARREEPRIRARTVPPTEQEAEEAGPESEALAQAEPPVPEAPSPQTEPERAPSRAAPTEVRPSPAGAQLRELSAEIRGSVARTLGEMLGRDLGDRLAQVTGRLLVWWVDPTRDLRRGDSLRILYELPEEGEPIVHALAFHSQKLGQTFEAFRYQARGEEFPRYYDRQGREVELRLENSPIERYEQITSLLRDGRGHQGMDFKAPVGVPVVAPFAAVVTRVNFNQRINGRCVEMEDAKGRRISFLHLSEVAPEMRPGARVSRGQLVGLSGNTGRSTAPHLHYQILSKSGRVLDPLKEHPTYRKSLPKSELAAFQAAVERLDRRLRLAAAD